ncbi:MAG TPA: V-type ATP synthase subunit E family protein [Thermoplasmata archaeon]|nr:V-type ATP synthase subunit E family protein [Thermoplasmata archaeon]
MSLERLVDEIRLKAEQELAEEHARADAQERAIALERDRRTKQVREDGQRLADVDAKRERAQKLAGAKLQARKVVYEARERRTNDQLGQVRELLAEVTESDEYPAVLKRMYAVAVDQLGKQLRVMGRKDDAAQLKSIAGRSFDDTVVPIVGGLIAETPDGSRRLNLSFDELLRLREDAVRSLLAA